MWVVAIAFVKLAFVASFSSICKFYNQFNSASAIILRYGKQLKMPNLRVSASAPNTDYDAAQALLDLQSNVREPRTESYTQQSSDYIDMEKTAKLFLSCFITSEVPVSTNKSIANSNVPCSFIENTPKNKHKKSVSHSANIENNAFYSNSNVSDMITSNDYELDCLKSVTSMRSKNRKRKYTQAYQESLISENIMNKKYTRRTREIGTQTENEYQFSLIKTMESTIKNLCAKIQSLEAQIKLSNSQLTEFESLNQDSSENEDENICSTSLKDFDNMNNQEDSVSEHLNITQRFVAYNPHGAQYKENKVLANYNKNVSSNDMVPIGDGNATVSSRILKHINWTSYTSATRKLLTAVFSRRVLATHSLTGKPSPAFPNKPAKKKLDPALVNDIVQTVVERCSVPENVVRTSITTKCADESKMFRSRQQNKKRRKHKLNRENISPHSSESED